jgi:hypothetical protein
MAKVYLDACIVVYVIPLAAAILGGCDEFWSNDLRLTAAAEGRIALRVLPEDEGPGATT